MTIPRIIHQLWIGPKPRPSKFMQTWEDKHPDFEYIMWNEEEIKKRELHLVCIDKINSIEEINGKADIIRWEILYHYGGVFLDADSICIESFHELVEKEQAFAGYENEQIRKGLVATGTMAFPKNHPLPANAIKWMLNNEVTRAKTGKMAWQTVGPGLLTGLLNSGHFADVVIYPSYLFLPKHGTGLQYMGHSKVYAYQEWGSTKQNYEIMNTIELDEIYKEPTNWVSILISSYNTNHKYIVECLESIKKQNGHYGMEIVWINDGSNELSTKLLEKTIPEFEKSMRFTKFIYKKWDKNMGLVYSLNKGIELCNNDLIFRFDSDDIMHQDRIIKQIEYMNLNNDCVICGTNVHFLKEINGEKITNGQTNHKEILTWKEYKQKPIHWIANHPTLCLKKSAILEVGNYNINNKLPCEDFELELKLLKKFGKIYNIQENLLYYRLHEYQVTANGNTSKPEVLKFRNEFIEKMINE